MNLSFSFIIPVYNRPDEIKELLKSFLHQTYTSAYEIVIIEDGSTLSSEEIIATYKDQLHISYYKKPNSGPGDSRNYGMERAKGNYFIVLDSDCILPPQYLKEVEASLQDHYVDCFGGPDAAHTSFSVVQKAINYAMTSVFTTGGIRGNKMAVDKFQPRSFNMGISKALFKDVGGFGNIHPGEDPDLTFRIWNKGYKTKLIPEAFLYHKRRINWSKFYVQVNKFGMVRPILNKWHPKNSKVTYWFPTIFCASFIVALMMLVFGFYMLMYLFVCYYGLIFMDSFIKNKSLSVALLSLLAVSIQFFGYGYGFLKSTLTLHFIRKEPELLFPKLFFKKTAYIERENHNKS